MSNASTSAERRYEIACKEAMAKARFSGPRRREWIIWGSKHRKCPVSECAAVVGEACFNILEKRKGHGKPNRWPHDDRIDWPKIYDGLKLRGYLVDAENYKP